MSLEFGGAADHRIDLASLGLRVEVDREVFERALRCLFLFLSLLPASALSFLSFGTLLMPWLM